MKYEKIISYCAAVGCPSIQESEETGDYVIVGKIIDEKELNEVGLAEKVGKGETAVKVPKKLIEDLVKKLKNN